MAIDDFLTKLYTKYQTPAPTLTSTRNNVRSTGLGTATISPVEKIIGSASDRGIAFQSDLGRLQSGAKDNYQAKRSNSNVQLAQTIASQSAAQTPVDEYGIVQKKMTSPLIASKLNLGAIGQRGELAAQTEESKAQWQLMKKMQDLSQYNVSTVFGSTYDPKLIAPGASQNNPGAQALAIAMTALKNHTPYVWGGNSLSQGVDCSGLVQQAYARLGIKLPRTTYEQAKSGQIVNVNSALPGDLVFYNTGSRDPNGIGNNGHVGIYMGNGQILEAANSRAGIRISSINGANGSPSLVVRPWS